MYGRGEIGKTRTLRMVLDLINGVDFSYAIDDIRATCTYNNQVVDITTWGDNRDELLNNVSYFKENPCDIAITAARKFGSTHEIIRNFAAETGAEIVWVYKRPELGDEWAINEKYARHIMSLL